MMWKLTMHMILLECLTVTVFFAIVAAVETGSLVFVTIIVAAASSHNPTLVGALTRLQRCAFSRSREIQIIDAQALTTVSNQ